MYEVYGGIVGAVVGLLLGFWLSELRDPRILEKMFAGMVLGAIVGVVLVAVGQGAVK